MSRRMTTWRRRTALRRLARQLRSQDPELARLLSGRGPSLLPPLRFTSIPVQGYVVIGAVLVVMGLYLSVTSAVLWGALSLAAAAVRHNVQPGERSFDLPRGTQPDRRGYREI